MRKFSSVLGNPATSVQRGIVFYIWAVLLFTCVGVLVCGTQRYIRHSGYPRNTLLFIPESNFTDFSGAAIRVTHFGAPDMLTRPDFGGKGYENFPYPVPAVYVHLFYNQFRHPFRVYVGTVIAAMLLAVLVLAIALRPFRGGTYLPYWAVLVTLLTPFPLLFLLQRGNLEGFVWILLVAGILLFHRELYYYSAVFLAAAAAIKIFPALLFLIFIARRKYYAFAAALFATAAITIASWAGVGPSILQAAIDGSTGSSTYLQKRYIVAIRPFELGWDHSLFGAIKQGLYTVSVFRHLKHPDTTVFQISGLETAATIYGVAAPVAFILFYWRRLYRLPVLNQLIALLILSVMLPFISNEYTLVHIYIAWGAFVLFLYRDVRTGLVEIPFWKLATILICFAVVFSPQSYWVFGSADSFGGQIKLGALAALLCVVSTTPMPSSGLGDLQEC
jgi:hypothetical protein